MTQAEIFSREIDMEAGASRKCLERMKAELYDWKPHEKSMKMGYLALMVADMPRWITFMIKDGAIDLAAYPHVKVASGEEFAKHFDEAIAGAKEALSGMSDEQLAEDFVLKSGEQVLLKMSKSESIASTLNHWVHHRGQLTVYMRLNDIAVPSLYGPSADEKTF